jgi:hypothetical protein
MKHRATLLIILATISVPKAALAWEVELTLEPGQPAQPVTLPPGLSAVEVTVTVAELDLLPGEAPSPRIFRFAGRPVTVTPTIAPQPYRIRQISLGGRQLLLVEAARFLAAGRVRRVRLRLVAQPAPGLRLPPVPEGWIEALPAPEPVLAIVTTRLVVARSGALGRYIRWREAQGLEVILGTEDEWDLPSDQPPDGRAERIRAWLRSIRDERGLGSALLIGDPSPGGIDGIPMKETHPLSALVRTYPEELWDHIEPVPTDQYYAELDGNWDLDGDGNFAVFPLDRGSGGIIWEPDLLVGRVPVYWNDVRRLDQILDAIIDYESSPDPSYRHRLLLPAAFIGFEGSRTPTGGSYRETIDGAMVTEVIHQTAAALNPTAELIRFYEETGQVTSELPHEQPLDAWTLRREWQQGAGLLVAVGHGSPEGIYRSIWHGDYDDDGEPDDDEVWGEPFISSWDLDGLDRSPPAFVFLATCENGWPEFPENLGFALLAQGAVATMASSRIAIGGDTNFRPAPELGDADTLAYTFTHLMLEGLSAGAAAAYLRYGLPADEWGFGNGYPMGGYGWLGKLEFNLYGDPLVGLDICPDDEACAPATACMGAGQCVDGFCVRRGPQVDCSELDSPCLVGSCDPDTGDCLALPRDDGTSCDDGLFCTEEDQCLRGECAGSAVICRTIEGYPGECVEEAGDCMYDFEPEPSPFERPYEEEDAPEVFGSACESCQTVGARLPSRLGFRALDLLLM